MPRELADALRLRLHDIPMIEWLQMDMHWYAEAVTCVNAYREGQRVAQEMAGRKAS